MSALLAKLNKIEQDIEHWEAELVAAKPDEDMSKVKETLDDLKQQRDRIVASPTYKKEQEDAERKAAEDAEKPAARAEEGAQDVKSNAPKASPTSREIEEHKASNLLTMRQNLTDMVVQYSAHPDHDKNLPPHDDIPVVIIEDPTTGKPKPMTAPKGQYQVCARCEWARRANLLKRQIKALEETDVEKLLDLDTEFDTELTD